MKPTNIKELLEFLWDNKNSNFYRNKFEAAGFDRESLSKEENFDKLPFLTRADLESASADERLFVDFSDVKFIAYTSGTSSQNPLVNYFSDIDDYYFRPSLGMGIKKILITYPPLNKNFSHTFIQQCAQDSNRPVSIFGDFLNLPNSAILASKVGVDAIYATPTIAAMLAEHLKNHYDTRKIKLLVLSSETLTSARRAQLEKDYPNADIANLYASSEIGQFLLYPCVDLIKNDKDYFHVVESPLIKVEIIESELVVTIGHNLAMPLIRYKTGDYFDIVDEKCSCGKKGLLLKWQGRSGVDKIRAGGVEIKIDDVENVFSKLDHLIGDKYQLHFYEENIGSEIKIKLVIEILESVIDQKGLSKEVVEKSILDYILENWRLSATAVLGDAVKKGFFYYPEIKFVKDFSYNSLKMRRIVSHLDKK